MKYTDWLKLLKAGDKVILHKHGFSYELYEDCTVSKITPKGFIKVDVFLFEPQNGFCRGNYGVNILDPSDEDTIKRIKRYKLNEFIKNVIYKMKNVSSLSYEKAVAINEILEGKNEKD